MLGKSHFVQSHLKKSNSGRSTYASVSFTKNAFLWYGISEKRWDLTKYLARILKTGEAVFLRRITKLEQATLQTGVDIRITNEIRAGVHTKLAELGLDPLDTTANELFHALKLKVLADENKIKTILGVKDMAKSVEILTAVAKFLQPYADKQEVWSIKKSSLRRMLQTAKMTKTMKVLHYRSESSLLKRESVLELYATAMLVEGETFRQKILQSMKKMRPSDFEQRPVELICFSAKRWALIAEIMKKQTSPVFSLPEVNALIVIPVNISGTQGLALLAMSLILKEIRHIKQHAAYIKLRTLDPHLHNHMQTIAQHGHIPVFTLHNEQIYWHHMHRLIGRSKSLQEALGPHITPLELSWMSIEAYLSSICPDLAFWIDTHQLAFVSDEHVVSLHIMDICFSVLFDMSLSDSSTVFVREIVNDELLERYLELPPFSRIFEEEAYKLTDIETNLVYA